MESGKSCKQMQCTYLYFCDDKNALEGILGSHPKSLSNEKKLLKLEFYTEISLDMFHSLQPADLNFPPKWSNLSNLVQKLDFFSSKYLVLNQILFEHIIMLLASCVVNGNS